MAEPIKIHPFDLYLMMNKRLASVDMVINYRSDSENKKLPENQFFIDGILYEQTTDIPPTKEVLEVIS